MAGASGSVTFPHASAFAPPLCISFRLLLPVQLPSSSLSSWFAEAPWGYFQFSSGLWPVVSMGPMSTSTRYFFFICAGFVVVIVIRTGVAQLSERVKRVLKKKKDNYFDNGELLRAFWGWTGATAAAGSCRLAPVLSHVRRTQGM